MDKHAPDLLEKFCWPSRDDLSMLQSLAYHSEKHMEVRKNFQSPSVSEKDQVTNMLEDLYKPIHGTFNKRDLDRRLFIDILKEVDLDATPGYPWKDTYKTNKDFLQNEDGTPNMANIELLYQVVEQRLEDLKTKPVADDISLFIKDELHKSTKKDSGAWRMISSVGLTDCCVDRVLFGEFFKSLYTVNGYTQTPNKAGWSPYKGGFKYLARKFKMTTTKQLMKDKKCWDWTMQAWIADILTKTMIRFCGFSDPIRIGQIVNRMLVLFKYDVFRFGEIRFSQLFAGIMKSGCLGTIAWNGMAQVCLHLLACLRMRIDPYANVPDVLGDDTVQGLMEQLERYLEQIEKAGCICREFQIVSLSQGEQIEFAGHHFDLHKSIPAYTGKHLAMLLTTSEFKLQQLESYLRMYAYDPEMYCRLVAWITHLGGRIYSREYLMDWYEGLVE